MTDHSDYVLMRLGLGVTAAEIATELEITPRHVRRIAKLAGWTPPPRRHTGPRTLRVLVPPEVWAALEARGGRSVEDTAWALLGMVADATRLGRERARAEAKRINGEAHWALGYLDALVAKIERVK